MRRGTQGHVAAPRGPAQRAYVAPRFIIYIYNLSYIKGVFVLPYIWGGSYPYKPSGYLNTTVSKLPSVWD